jgi:tetratricopeptide (TPR) repeat protein
LIDATVAIELDPTYARAYFRRGNVLIKLKQWSEAAADFAKVCELNPRFKPAREKALLCQRHLLDHEAQKLVQQSACGDEKKSSEPDDLPDKPADDLKVSATSVLRMKHPDHQFPIVDTSITSPTDSKATECSFDTSNLKIPAVGSSYSFASSRPTYVQNTSTAELQPSKWTHNVLSSYHWTQYLTNDLATKCTFPTPQSAYDSFMSEKKNMDNADEAIDTSACVPEVPALPFYDPIIALSRQYAAHSGTHIPGANTSFEQRRVVTDDLTHAAMSDWAAVNISDFPDVVMRDTAHAPTTAVNAGSFPFSAGPLLQRGLSGLKLLQDYMHVSEQLTVDWSFELHKLRHAADSGPSSSSSSASLMNGMLAEPSTLASEWMHQRRLHRLVCLFEKHATRVCKIFAAHLIAEEPLLSSVIQESSSLAFQATTADTRTKVCAASWRKALLAGRTLVVGHTAYCLVHDRDGSCGGDAEVHRLYSNHIRASNAIASLGAHELQAALSLLVTVHGISLFAYAIPCPNNIRGNEFVFGSRDGGHSVYATSAAVLDQVSRVSSRMNLAPHAVALPNGVPSSAHGAPHMFAQPASTVMQVHQVFAPKPRMVVTNATYVLPSMPIHHDIAQTEPVGLCTFLGVRVPEEMGSKLVHGVESVPRTINSPSTHCALLGYVSTSSGEQHDVGIMSLMASIAPNWYSKCAEPEAIPDILMHVFGVASHGLHRARSAASSSNTVSSAAVSPSPFASDHSVPLAFVGAKHTASHSPSSAPRAHGFKFDKPEDLLGKPVSASSCANSSPEWWRHTARFRPEFLQLYCTAYPLSSDSGTPFVHEHDASTFEHRSERASAFLHRFVIPSVAQELDHIVDGSGSTSRATKYTVMDDAQMQRYLERRFPFDGADAVARDADGYPMGIPPHNVSLDTQSSAPEIFQVPDMKLNTADNVTTSSNCDSNNSSSNSSDTEPVIVQLEQDEDLKLPSSLEEHWATPSALATVRSILTGAPTGNDLSSDNTQPSSSSGDDTAAAAAAAAADIASAVAKHPSSFGNISPDVLKRFPLLLHVKRDVWRPKVHIKDVPELHNFYQKHNTFVRRTFGASQASPQSGARALTHCSYRSVIDPFCANGVTKLFHSRGVNMRFLAEVRLHTTHVEARRLLTQEMICRVIKHQIQELSRHSSSLEEPQLIVTRYLMTLFGVIPSPPVQPTDSQPLKVEAGPLDMRPQVFPPIATADLWGRSIPASIVHKYGRACGPYLREDIAYFKQLCVDFGLLLCANLVSRKDRRFYESSELMHFAERLFSCIGVDYEPLQSEIFDDPEAAGAYMASSHAGSPDGLSGSPDMGSSSDQSASDSNSNSSSSVGSNSNSNRSSDSTGTARSRIIASSSSNVISSTAAPHTMAYHQRSHEVAISNVPQSIRPWACQASNLETHVPPSLYGDHPTLPQYPYSRFESVASNHGSSRTVSLSKHVHRFVCAKLVDILQTGLSLAPLLCPHVIQPTFGLHAAPEFATASKHAHLFHHLFEVVTLCPKTKSVQPPPFMPTLEDAHWYRLYVLQRRAYAVGPTNPALVGELLELLDLYETYMLHEAEASRRFGKMACMHLNAIAKVHTTKVLGVATRVAQFLSKAGEHDAAARLLQDELNTSGWNKTLWAQSSNRVDLSLIRHPDRVLSAAEQPTPAFWERLAKLALMASNPVLTRRSTEDDGKLPGHLRPADSKSVTVCDHNSGTEQTHATDDGDNDEDDFTQDDSTPWTLDSIFDLSHSPEWFVAAWDKQIQSPSTTAVQRLYMSPSEAEARAECNTATEQDIALPNNRATPAEPIRMPGWNELLHLSRAESALSHTDAIDWWDRMNHSLLDLYVCADDDDKATDGFDLDTRASVLLPPHEHALYQDIADPYVPYEAKLGPSSEDALDRISLEECANTFHLSMFAVDDPSCGAIVPDIPASCVGSRDARYFTLWGITLERMAQELCFLGRVSEAQSAISSALGLYQAVYGVKHAVYGRALARASRIHMVLGEYHIAAQHLLIALEIHVVHSAPLELDSAALLYNIAQVMAWNLQQTDSHLKLERSLLTRAIGISSSWSGASDLLHGALLFAMGRLELSDGDMNRSVASLSRALRTGLSCGGQDHWLVGQTLLELGRLRMEAGDFTEALLLMRRGALVVESSLGVYDLATVRAYTSVGQMHAIMGENARSLLALQQAKEPFMRAIQSGEHPELINVLLLHAIARLQLSDVEPPLPKFIQLLQRNLELFGELCTPIHHLLFGIINSHVCLLKGDMEASCRVLDETVERIGHDQIFSCSYGNAAALLCLADLYTLQGRDKEQRHVSYFGWLCRKHLNNGTGSHPLQALFALQLATSDLSACDDARAIQRVCNARDIIQEQLGSNNSHCAHADLIYALVWLRRNHGRQALAAAERARNVFETALLPKSPRVALSRVLASIAYDTLFTESLWVVASADDILAMAKERFGAQEFYGTPLSDIADQQQYHLPSVAAFLCESELESPLLQLVAYSFKPMVVDLLKKHRSVHALLKDHIKDARELAGKEAQVVAAIAAASLSSRGSSGSRHVPLIESHPSTPSIEESG